MQRTAAWWYLVLILGLGIAVRSFELTTRSLWFDEAFSWRLLQFPWPEMLTRIQADVHPPLYYILLRCWAFVFGSSAVAIRSLSVVFATATLWAAYIFTSTALRSRGAGLLASLLLSVSAWQIQYATEARMYTMGTTLVLLSSWLLLRAVRQPKQKIMWWFAYAVSATAFAYTHYYAFFALSAHALFVSGFVLYHTKGRVGEMLQWRLVWYAAFSGIVTAVLMLPWLPTVVQQMQQVQQQYWVPTPDSWSLPTTMRQQFMPSVQGPRHDTVWSATLTLVPLLIILGVWYSLVRRSFRQRANADAYWLIILLGAVPFALSLPLSLASQSIYQDRFFLFAHVFIVIALAALLTNLSRRWARISGSTVVVFGFMAASIAYWSALDLGHRPGLHVAAQHVLSQAQPTEPIVVSSPFIFFPLLHYAQEEFGTSAVTLMLNDGGLDHYAGQPILTTSDIASSQLFESPTVSVIWLVETDGFSSQPARISAEWKREKTESFAEVFPYQGSITVSRLVRSRF